MLRTTGSTKAAGPRRTAGLLRNGSTATTGSTAAALAMQLTIVVAVGVTVRLGLLGWSVTVGCVALLDAAVAAALRRDVRGPRPGDQVTLVRAVLACIVAALTAEALVLHRPVTSVLVPLSAVALVMDALDGWVARHTRTTSHFGQRFDGEVDAFLILVLSIYLVPVSGVWVLAAGLARYLFGAAGWRLPWFRAQLPYRYWRKVVTATVGVALTVAAAQVLPPPLSLALLVAAMGLLAESFARDVWWLWRRRRVDASATGPVASVLAPSPELV